jgi:SAM-dependent methyltransferase
MAAPTRWVTETADEHSATYVAHFRKLAGEGADLSGEARLVDAMAPRGALLLDAGCGQGRTAGALHRAGHRVVGVDADAVLLAAAREDNPGPTYLHADLSELDLEAAGVESPVDGAVMAGNVMPYVAPGTEVAVLSRLGAHLLPDGFLVIGFGAGRGYDLASFDRHLAEAGLTLEHRFGTWDLRPWTESSDFAVTVVRRPA